MAATPTALQKNTKEETFGVLCDDFKLRKKVYEAILAADIQDLEEFRLYFAEEGQVAPWIAKIVDLVKPDIQATRLRRAWYAVRRQGEFRDTDKSKAPIAGLDEMLDDDELNDTKSKFWRRYKIRFPPEVMPADSLVSRIHREMHKTLLMMFNLWLVKNLMHQVTSTRKRQKLGDNLYTDAAEEGGDPKLGEGCADGAVAENTLGSASNKFVQVPLDIALAYYFRAVRAVAMQPYSHQLAWLERTCTEERSVWVQKFRESTDDLGDVETLAGKKVMLNANGRKLCKRFKLGQCQNQNCNQGLHRCAIDDHMPISCEHFHPPLMANLMCGMNAQTSKAFQFCGWRTFSVDWKLDPEHDLGNPDCQVELAERIGEAAFIMAAPLERDRQRIESELSASDFTLTQISKVVERGGGSVRENPARSLHWLCDQEVEMWGSGLWRDKQFDACALMSARCKARILRHNLDEMDVLLDATCAHLHDEAEWQPWTSADGELVDPDSEEPMTRRLCPLLLPLRVRRMPSIARAGNRKPWLLLDPRAMREWVVVPMALMLGLDVSSQVNLREVPARRSIQDFDLKDIKSRGLPINHVYVDAGHHSHRLPCAIWSSPFVPGKHGTWMFSGLAM
ncbi:unnamed protein product [Polarella glacialis]|uniref:Uncharacterized protein n=1 Tax=Polarella glacialis TaxID=89957 RepID=A0A813I4V8_POLGL|nr:unnamed protein product [Polarella glacialis]